MPHIELCLHHNHLKDMTSRGLKSMQGFLKLTITILFLVDQIGKRSNKVKFMPF